MKKWFKKSAMGWAGRLPVDHMTHVSGSASHLDGYLSLQVVVTVDNGFH